VCAGTAQTDELLLRQINDPPDATSSADAFRGDPTTTTTTTTTTSTQRAVDLARKDRKNSVVIAQTVGGDVIVELTGVDDEISSAAERCASDQSIHREEPATAATGSSPRSQVRGGLDETTHLRVTTCPSSPEYRTFDSDDFVDK